MKYKVIVDDSKGKSPVTDYSFNSCYAEDFESETFEELVHCASFFYLNLKNTDLDEIYVIIKSVDKESYCRVKLFKKVIFSGHYLGEVR